MEKQIFQSVEKATSIKDFVYNQLKMAILTHQLRPGERVTEAGLANQMEVSHTPIREALRDLAQEGLIDIIPNKGSYVASLTAEDIEEIYKLRIGLEQLALKLSKGKMHDGRIQQMEDYANKCLKAVRSNRLKEYNEYDSLFHLNLIRLSENSRLERFYSTLKGQIQLIMVAAITDPTHLNPQQKTPDHFEIIRNLKEENIPAVCAVLEDHIQSALKDALKNVGNGAI